MTRKITRDERLAVRTVRRGAGCRGNVAVAQLATDLHGQPSHLAIAGTGRDTVKTSWLDCVAIEPMAVTVAPDEASALILSLPPAWVAGGPADGGGCPRGPVRGGPGRDVLLTGGAELGGGGEAAGLRGDAR